VTATESITPIQNAVNIGPVLTQRLLAVGVTTLDEVRERGAIEVWQLIADTAEGNERAHMLLALEGALRGQRWTSIPRSERDALLVEVGLKDASEVTPPKKK
jgi:DNA transformation protein